VDSSLQELERRYRETGLEEDEAAWLRARMQAGGLGADQVRLAALCGHSAAALSLERGESRPADFPSWLSHVRSHGAEAERRAHLAAARESLRVRNREAELHGAEDDIAEHPSLLLELAEELLFEPEDPELQDFLGGLASTQDAWEWTNDVSESAMWALNLISALGNSEDDLDWSNLLLEALYEERARAVVSAELVPWVLGYHDPVLERVRARRAENHTKAEHRQRGSR
tara:strand:- start:288 stop:974 length:687 start_codon:yes stop_codon:yes gene_type:complete